jgi:hypothetical protein
MIEDKDLLEYIRQHYLQILKREPDEIGLKSYFERIKKNEIKISDLCNIFENSFEHNIRNSVDKTIEQQQKNFEEKNKNFIKILQDFKSEFQSSQIEKKIEPGFIFVSGFDSKSHKGGIYRIHENKIKTLFDEAGCFGIFYEKKNQILFGITRRNPDTPGDNSQIIAFKIHDSQNIERIPIKFMNYIYAGESHGLCIFNDKLISVGTNGTPEGELATNDDFKNGLVGKIITSDIEYHDHEIIIKNSKIYNPFDCSHHHHINDICECDGTLYMTAFSYCDKNKKYISKGNVSKLNSDFSAEVISDNLEMPHSLYYFRNRLYICSSGLAMVVSLDLNDNSLRLEYKGIDAFCRGILITDNYFYIGYSYSLERTNSKFTNTTSGIIQFNRETGESEKIILPSNINNIYDMQGIL